MKVCDGNTLAAHAYRFLILATSVAMSVAIDTAAKGGGATVTSYGPWNVIQNQSSTKSDPRCKWYAFGDFNYDNATLVNCLAVLWVELNDPTANPPHTLRPYIYYSDEKFLNPYTAENPCYIGCFGGGSVPSLMRLSKSRSLLSQFVLAGTLVFLVGA